MTTAARHARNARQSEPRGASPRTGHVRAWHLFRSPGFSRRAGSALTRRRPPRPARGGGPARRGRREARGHPPGAPLPGPPRALRPPTGPAPAAFHHPSRRDLTASPARWVPAPERRDRATFGLPRRGRTAERCTDLCSSPGSRPGANRISRCEESAKPRNPRAGTAGRPPGCGDGPGVYPAPRRFQHGIPRFSLSDPQAYGFRPAHRTPLRTRLPGRSCPASATSIRNTFFQSALRNHRPPDGPPAVSILGTANS